MAREASFMIDVNVFVNLSCDVGESDLGCCGRSRLLLYMHSGLDIRLHRISFNGYIQLRLHNYLEPRLLLDIKKLDHM